jgi:transposase InsO family protein
MPDVQKMVREAAIEDEQYQSALEDVRKGRAGPEFSEGEGGLLYYTAKSGATPVLYIPCCELRYVLMREAHDPPTSGHLGRDKTVARLKKDYYWPGMDKSVDQFVRTCLSCQQNKGSTKTPQGLIMPLPIPERSWECISMDFVVQLPLTKDGFDAIFVVVDRMSKMIHPILTRTNITAEEAASQFFREIFRIHGLPKSIVSDRDAKFTSTFWRALFKLTGTALDMSTAYHPQTDGQTERANRTVEEMLRHFCNDRMDDWDEYLPAVEFAYNSSKQASTGLTPFYVNYGYEPHTPLALLRGGNQSGNAGVDHFVGNIREAISQTKDNLEAAQKRMVANEDAHRRDHAITVGSKVLLSTEHLKTPRSGKLSELYCGPFEVVEAISRNAIKLKLPKTMKIHPVRNVSELKLVEEDTTHPNRMAPTRPPPVVSKEGNAEFKIERIVGRKQQAFGRGKTRRHAWAYEVKWEGYSRMENTWICEEYLREDGVGHMLDEYDKTYPRP